MNLRPRLKKSKKLMEIDALLYTHISIPTIQARVREKFGEEYSQSALKRRRIELQVATDAAGNLAKLDAPRRTRPKAKDITKLYADGKELVKIAEVVLPEGHPLKGLMKTFGDRLGSSFRWAAELFEDIDFLAYLRYIINAQHMRVARGLELEAQLNLNIRDTEASMDMLMRSIQTAIELYREMGLKPRFGDPDENRAANAGASVRETEDVRLKRLRDFQAKMKTLSPEEQAVERRRFLGLPDPPAPKPMDDEKREQPTASPALRNVV